MTKEKEEDLGAKQQEYKKAVEIKLKDEYLKVAEKKFKKENYLGAADMAYKVGDEGLLLRCIDKMIRKGQYLKAGQFLEAANPKEARKYIERLGKYDEGVYSAEAGALAALRDEEKLARHYATIASNKRDYAGAKRVYTILEKVKSGELEEEAKAQQEASKKEAAA